MRLQSKVSHLMGGKMRHAAGHERPESAWLVTSFSIVLRPWVNATWFSLI